MKQKNYKRNRTNAYMILLFAGIWTVFSFFNDWVAIEFSLYACGLALVVYIINTLFPQTLSDEKKGHEIKFSIGDRIIRAISLLLLR